VAGSFTRLCGEVDKRGHPYTGRLGNAPNPDFIVHVPSTDDNYAVIEVKTIDNLGGIDNDVRKLQAFLDHCHYRRAIHFVFGENTQAILDTIGHENINPAYRILESRSGW
jgi:hypothetical protein